MGVESEELIRLLLIVEKRRRKRGGIEWIVDFAENESLFFACSFFISFLSVYKNEKNNNNNNYLYIIFV